MDGRVHARGGCMHECVDGWMDRWMDGWMYAWMRFKSIGLDTYMHDVLGGGIY